MTKTKIRVVKWLLNTLTWKNLTSLCLLDCRVTDLPFICVLCDIWMNILCVCAGRLVKHTSMRKREGVIWSRACDYDSGPIHPGWGLHKQTRTRSLSETNGYWSRRWRLIELHRLKVSSRLKADKSDTEQRLKPDVEQSRFLWSSCPFWGWEDTNDHSFVFSIDFVLNCFSTDCLQSVTTEKLPCFSHVCCSPERCLEGRHVWINIPQHICSGFLVHIVKTSSTLAWAGRDFSKTFELVCLVVQIPAYFLNEHSGSQKWHFQEGNRGIQRHS